MKEVLVTLKEMFCSIFTKIWGFKKYIITLAIVGILLSGIGGAANYYFNPRGVVTAVNGETITISDFFGSRDVNLEGSTVNMNNIKTNDKIMVKRSFNGTILAVKTSGDRHSRVDKHDRFEKHDKRNR